MSVTGSNKHLARISNCSYYLIIFFEKTNRKKPQYSWLTVKMLFVQSIAGKKHPFQNSCSQEGFLFVMQKLMDRCDSLTPLVFRERVKNEYTP